MGQVYRARDTRLDRTVALKILPAEYRADPALKQRFDREARTIAARTLRTSACDRRARHRSS
jgi:serine/threonine protein kinase